MHNTRVVYAVTWQKSLGTRLAVTHDILEICAYKLVEFHNFGKICITSYFVFSAIHAADVLTCFALPPPGHGISFLCCDLHVPVLCIPTIAWQTRRLILLWCNMCSDSSGLFGAIDLVLTLAKDVICMISLFLLGTDSTEIVYPKHITVIYRTIGNFPLVQS